MFEKEMKTYQERLPDLLKTDAGKYAVIKGDEVIGTYVSIEDALSVGYDRFKKELFMVKQILLFQKPLDFTNNFNVA